MISHLLKHRFGSYRALSVAAVVLVAALITGCRAKPAPEPQKVVLPLNTFKYDWKRDLSLKKDPAASIHLRGDELYLLTRDGQSAAFKRDAGRLHTLYTIPNAKTDLHPPVVLPKYVVYPTATQLQVYARDGRHIRTIDLPFAVLSDAVGIGENIFFGGDFPNRGGGRLVRAQVTHPLVPVRWELMILTGSFPGAPAVVEANVYAGGQDGHVYAVTVEDREPIWGQVTFKTGAGIRADIQADANHIYVASLDSVLYAINRRTGQRRWQFFAGKALDRAPSITADRVYLPVPERGIVVLSKEPNPVAGDPLRAIDRSPMWESKSAVQLLAQDDKFAYLLHSDNSIVAHDKTTGEQKFRTKRKEFELFTTNTVDNKIYAANKSGRVFEISAVLQPGVVGEQVIDEGTGKKRRR